MHAARARLDIVAALLTLGLGLSILYFAVALLGAVDPFGDSIVFTIIALVLMVAWLRRGLPALSGRHGRC